MFNFASYTRLIIINFINLGAMKFELKTHIDLLVLKACFITNHYNPIIN